VLVLRALTSRVRILCVREIQKSIRESVHRLLSDRIDALGLSAFFEIREHSITSRAGGEFIFEGLFANVSKIRSIEGVGLVWVEESESVSDRSLETLIPTIRQPASELWFSMNPDSPDAAAYRRFVTSPPTDCRHVHVTLEDNPWTPVELRREADYLRSVDVDAYQHVWLGHTRHVSAAQVFAGKYVSDEFVPCDQWDGPYLGVDFGFSQDPSVMVKVWISDATLYVEHEAYGLGVDIDKLPALFDGVPRARDYQVRADNSRPETISYLRQRGYPNMHSVDKWAGSVEDGIAHLRSYARIVVHPRCTHVLDELRLYSYRIDRLSGDVLPDLKPGNDHCIDALRYAVTPLIKRRGADGLLAYLAGGYAELQTAEEQKQRDNMHKMFGVKVTRLGH